MILVTKGVISSASSLSRRVGISFGPDAFPGLRFFSSLYTPASVTCSGSCGGYEGPSKLILAVSSSSTVKTEQNCSLRIPALVAGSDQSLLPFRSGDTPWLSCLVFGFGRNARRVSGHLLRAPKQHSVHVLPVCFLQGLLGTFLKLNEFLPAGSFLLGLGIETSFLAAHAAQG